MSDVTLTVIDDSTIVAQLVDNDVTVVQVDYQPIDVTVAEVGIQGASGRSQIFIDDTAPDPAVYPLWLDTTSIRGEDGGGSSGSSLVRAEYRTDNALIGATANIPWTYNADVQPDDPALYHPLDLTDPMFPTIVEDGIYAVSVFIRAEDWVGHPFTDLAGVTMAASLSLDDANFGWEMVATTPLTVDYVSFLSKHGSLSMSNTVWLPAGAACAVYVHHSNGSTDMPFTMFATVQKF